MENVLLVVHLIACIALVFAVMLQRSEGGALGMGGGGTGGIISGRGAAGVLVRVTMALAAVFFTTSIVMTRLNAEQARAPTELEKQLEQESNRLDLNGPTGPTTTTPPPAATVTPPAPTTPDPLAPTTPPASPAPSTTTTPAPSTATPAQPAPAPTRPTTPDPLAPAPNQ